MKYDELFSAKNLEELVNILNSNSSRYLGAWDTIMDVLDVMKEMDGVQLVEVDKMDDPDVYPEVYMDDDEFGNPDVSAMAFKQLSPSKYQVMVLCNEPKGKDFDIEIWPTKLIKQRLIVKG